MDIAQIGHSVLSSQAEEVCFPIQEEDLQFVSQMLTALKEKNGVGIAAPQLYRELRIIIVASSPNERYPKAPSFGPVTMVNPEITVYSEEKQSGWEGCLSVPGIRALVPRSQSITLKYYDTKGKKFTQDFDGFVARIIQHEVDHLNGMCFLERVEDKKSFTSETEYRRKHSITV